MAKIGDLELRPRRGSEDVLSRRDGRLRLNGRVEWLLEGPAGALARINETLGRVAEPFGKNVLLLRFGNAVGFFEAPGLGRFEVVSGKWSERDFDAMLMELSDVAVELPFSAPSPGALPFDRSLITRTPILYHLFVYLRYVLGEGAPAEEALAPALEAVVRDPHQKLVTEMHRVGIAQCRTVRPSELVAIASGKYPLTQVAERAATIPAALALGGRLPEEIDEPRARWTVDTPENRFVRMVIDLAEGILDQVEQRLPPRRRDRLIGDVREMRGRLEPFRRHGLWNQVGRLHRVPVESPVLQRRRGYKTVLSFYTRLRQASRVPLTSEELRRLLDARDIADLYELWCYFRLVSELREILGEPDHADAPVADVLHLAVPRNYRVTWSNGTSLAYNRRFSPAVDGVTRSYSVPLRPDIALEVATGPNQGYHLFDAKFKLERVDDMFSQTGDDESVEPSQRGFKRGDLYKMHTYRDAIAAARSVWVLYPGTVQKWYPATAVSQIDGVGALPLVPRGPTVSILRTLTRPNDIRGRSG